MASGEAMLAPNGFNGAQSPFAPKIEPGHPATSS